MRRYNGRFIFGFKGRTVTPFVTELIVERRIGGVILFSRNIQDRNQLAELCSELTRCRRSVSDYPLFIAVDQEGGAVNRVLDGVTLFPSPMAIASTGNVEYAKRVGSCMGSQLLSLGINMNIAPVLDVNTNRKNPFIGVRSYSDNPETVAIFGAAMIEGMQEAGVISVAKHFPGLGFAEMDPHHDLPVIAKSMDELEQQDLLPFKKAIEVGVGGIMVGHAHYPSVSQRPASLSERVIHGLLREKLGFQGMVLTDDLEMEAISSRRPVGDSVVKACKAGADLVLICHSSNEQIRALGDFSEAIKSGKLRSRHIKYSLKRIRACKGGMNERAEAALEAPVENAEYLVQEVAEAALALVSDKGGNLPLRIGDTEKLLLLCPNVGSLTAAEEEVSSGIGLVDIIKARHGNTDVVIFDVEPLNKNFTEVRRYLPNASAVIMATCNAHLYKEQERLIEEIVAADKPTIFVALRNPYDAELYPASSARLVAYGTDQYTLATVGKAIFGEIKPRGKVPVSLKC